METSQVSFKQIASRRCGLDVQSNASNKNRIIRILEDANIKLSSVLSATSGLVGTKLIDKICGLKKFCRPTTMHWNCSWKFRASALKALNILLLKSDWTWTFSHRKASDLLGRHGARQQRDRR